MVKDVPIPEEIRQKFLSFEERGSRLAKYFDDINFCVECDDRTVEEDMPSQSKGHNCLDKYFTKVISKDSNNCIMEMGKKNSKNSLLHDMSNSSSSEADVPSIKTTNQKNETDEEEGLFGGEELECEGSSTKPIIAAMNALGKLKRGIAEVGVDDNSSRDSTALVIDEEQLESEKDLPPSQDEPVKSISKKSLSSPVLNNEIASSKNSKDTNSRHSLTKQINKGAVGNETLSFSQFFNPAKESPRTQIGQKFSTSTPVEVSKAGKRKRNECSDSPERLAAKKNKDSDLGYNSDNMENLIEVTSFQDTNCSLFLEDLDSDDEIYVVQCPKDVNLQHLVGKQLELNGESVLKLQVNEDKRYYECFSQKDSMGRDVNMILPSRKEEALKFGVYQLKGSILISESMDDHEVITTDEETAIRNISSDNLKEKKPVDDISEVRETMPGKHKKHKTKINEDVTPVHGSDSSSSIRKKKKKKEKDNERNNELSSEPISQDSCEKLPKKKKKDKEKEITSRAEGKQLHKSEKELKKKKKDNNELKFVPESPSHQNEKQLKKKIKDVIVLQDPVIVEESECLDDEMGKKKKKKRKHKDETATINVETEKVEMSENAEDTPKEKLCLEESLLSSAIKKKKRKKDKDVVTEGEIDSVEYIGEPEVPDVEPPQKKKKKKKHEQEELLTIGQFEDEIADKKKHKQLLDTKDFDNARESSHLKLSTFIETDIQHLKKKKKKKKKKERNKSID